MSIYFTNTFKRIPAAVYPYAYFSVLVEVTERDVEKNGAKMRKHCLEIIFRGDTPTPVYAYKVVVAAGEKDFQENTSFQQM